MTGGSRTYRLRGLAPEAAYEIESLDTQTIVAGLGGDLMCGGFTVDIQGQPGAAVAPYRRITQERK